MPTVLLKEFLKRYAKALLKSLKGLRNLLI